MTVLDKVTTWVRLNHHHEKIFPNERHSNKTVSIFILKTIYFILQNMLRSLHTSSSVVHIKSTVNTQIIRVCYNVTVSL